MVIRSPRSMIYWKLTSTLLLVIIPMYIISLLMNQSGAEIVRQGNYRLMEQRTSFMIASIEAEINRLVQLQRDMNNDMDLQNLSIRSSSLASYEWTKAMNDLYSKLAMLASSSRYVREAFVLMPNVGKRLSSLSKMEELDMSEWQAMNAPLAPDEKYLYRNERLYSTIGYPVTTRTQYLLVIEISLDRIGRDLAFFEGNPNDSIYLLDKRHGFILSPTPPDEERAAILRRHERGDQRVNVGGKPVLFFETYSESLDWYLVAMLDEDEVLAPVTEFKKWYWLLSLISVGVILAVSFSIYRLIHRPLQKLVKAFRQVEKGQLSITVSRKGKDEFHYLYEQFNRMVGQLGKLIREVYEQTILNQKSELKQLQSQINPHFLYNSLYILYRMAQNEDFEGVSALSKHLGDYFKFITQNKKDLIPLENEINHAKAYAAIQQTRFNNRIACSFEAAGPVAAWEVPRLVLQPLLENAFVHGLENVTGEGRIRTAVRAEPDKLIIEVCDNGAGMSEERIAAWNERLRHVRSDDGEPDSNGIWNVNRRISLQFGKRSGLRLTRNEGNGICVVMTIEPNGGEDDV